MKKIIYNDNNLIKDDINNVIKRAKILIENSNGEILLVQSYNNYFFLGGHVENDEDDKTCLKRELLEEAGMDVSLDNIELFMRINYYNKDYPKSGINTYTVANYYVLKTDVKPNLSIINLTDDEKKGNFTIKSIKKDEIIDILDESRKYSTREGVVIDTINVLKEYLKK